MERCTAYSTVASGASAEALIETSRHLLATCCFGRGPLEQRGRQCYSGDGHLHAMVNRCSVWWCCATLCCSAIATAQWNCSCGSQSRLLSASFWRGLHFPVYLGLWPVLGLTAHMSFFVRNWRFGASKPENFSGPQAHVTGARSQTDTSAMRTFLKYRVFLLSHIRISTLARSRAGASRVGKTAAAPTCRYAVTREREHRHHNAQGQAHMLLAKSERSQNKRVPLTSVLRERSQHSA